MTSEEAIRLLTTKRAQPSTDWQMAEAYTMAIKALEQGPTYYPPCIDCNEKMDEIRRAYDKLKELPSVENKGDFDGMTNGEVLQTVIPKLAPIVLSNETGAVYFDWEWWDAPYKAESEE